MTVPGTTPPLDLRGRRLGEFVLGERIGEGAFGSIHLAQQLGLSRQVVVKILRSRFATDETMRLRFLREARLASTLDHPYAAHVYAFGVEPDGVSWIAMELVRGTSLGDVLAKGAMPLRDFVPFFERLCEVVQTAHEHGIVHRDIKPQNVMVITRAGALLPKLLDLGIAKDAALARQGEAVPDASVVRQATARARSISSLDRHPVADASSRAESLTGAGDLMGSPAYMAPEQWTSADQVDERCDIYALGVLAYEAVSGHRPFSGTMKELAEQHLVGSVPPLPEGLPGELHAVLERAMAKEPEARPASALELARAFREASRLGEGGLELPRLARDVAEVVLRDYPQPLAESVAELDGVRGAYRALEAATRLTRVTLRFLVVVALAAWSQRRAEQPLVPTATELLSALRKRRLEDAEWLDLLRALVTSHGSRSSEHPVPELVDAFGSGRPASVLLEELIERQAARATSTLPTEQAAADELSIVLARTSELLRSLSFLSDYPLAVTGDDDHAELWTGVRRRHRLAHALQPDAQLEPDAPVVLVRDGRALLLAPLALASRPSPNAERELFLLEGRGRRGILLVALPGGFEQTSEAALTWLDRMLAVTDDEESSVPTLEAPYRGLAPLTAADADVFFGREREVETFLNRLRSEPLLAVVGPSGAGKSSFVRAGVVPALGEALQAVVFRPGATPLAMLRTKLAQLGVQTDGLGAARDAREVAARVLAAARARDQTLAFFVDQFEEAFTLARDPEERAVFCAWLAAIASSTSDPARVVLTLRDDFLTKTQQESAFRDRLEHALVLLATPDAADLRRILVEPARRAGFAFETTALVDDMVRAVEGRPGALALLSFAASKLWEQRDPRARTLTRSAYESMGGVAGALAQHGEGLLAGMTSRQRHLVREAFRRLVTAEGTRATTRHDELLAILGGDEAARAVVEQLVAARLLVVSEREDGVEAVEVIHEALLTSWPRLVEWRREDAAGSRLRDQIRAAAQQWEAHGRSRGLLWRDELLDDYRRWRAQDSGGLTESEAAFGAASLDERNRGRRLRVAGVVLLVAATLITSYVAWQQSLARREAQRATQEARRATTEAERANRQAEESTLRARDAARLAAARLHAEDPTTQLALLRDLEASEPLPEWAPEARAALHAGVASVVHSAHTSAVWSVAFSPDGRRVASASDDGTIDVWNADGSGEPLVLRGHTNPVSGVAFSPDGRRIASSSADKTVRIWNADGSGAPLVLGGGTDSVYGVSFSPDGRRIASGGGARVRVWNTDGSGTPVVLRGHSERVRAVSFSPDGRRLASGCDDGTVGVWNADGSGRPLVLRGHTDHVSDVDFSPDGGHVASASEDKTVRLWSVAGSGEPIVLRGHTERVRAVAFSPDGRRVASGSDDKTVRIWNADGSGSPRVLRGHPDVVWSVAFSPDGGAVVSSDLVGTVRVWRVDVADDPLVLRGSTPMAEGLAVSPDGRLFASGADDKTVRVLRSDGTGELAVLRGHTDHVFGLAFSPDGRRLASGADDKTVRVWSVDGSGTPVVLRGHTGAVLGVSFGPDDRRVASASLDETVRVWNADGSGEPIVLRGHTGPVIGVDFSPDGRRVASASYDGTVRVWSVDGAGEPLVLRGHTGRVYNVSFSPRGDRIASGSEDKSVRVWNADGSGEPLVLLGHAGPMNSVSFSRDGRTIASASMDATIRIWDAEGRADPVVLHGRGEIPAAVAFSPDGRRLFSGSNDGAIRIWSDLAPLLPTDPRLWQATNYCLSPDLLESLLGVHADVAKALRRRCLERVASTSAGTP